MDDHRWCIDLSVPLVFGYEQTHKRFCSGGALSESDLESVLHFLCTHANLRPIFFLWQPFLPHPKDDFVLELAVESRADFRRSTITPSFGHDRATATKINVLRE